ncbi:hypothetical protein Taro_045294 [Colocasia esculenta]|uniref:Uncharacterized protein n=1 Tax=Colocasia esculenta TaxID=4460 RepID=A0A843WW91_COLES|nr:hypothetical protein [Colocasia esculenta]
MSGLEENKVCARGARQEVCTWYTKESATWGTKKRSTSSDGEVPKDTIRSVAPSGASATASGELRSQIPQSHKVLGMLYRYTNR